MNITNATEHAEAVEILKTLIVDENSSDVDTQALARDIEAYEERSPATRLKSKGRKPKSASEVDQYLRGGHRA